MNKERYEFTSRTKKRLLITGIAGFVLVLLGIILLKSSGHHDESGMMEEHAFSWTNRLLAELWVNNVFFTGVALTGVFFFAIQYVAQAGWSSYIIRVPLALGNWLPFALALILIVFFLGNFATDFRIFHWLDPALYDKASQHYDPELVSKHAFLNLPFFLIRLFVFFGVWILLFFTFKRLNFEEDIKGGLDNFKRMFSLSAVFVVVYAVTSSVTAWDWVMSIDAHWYSTLYGWYVFSSWFPASLAAITLIVVFLHDAGYLPGLTEEHLHDLG